jgi:hypothetical protein
MLTPRTPDLLSQAKQQQQKQPGVDKAQSIGTDVGTSSSSPAADQEVEASSDDSYPHLLPKVQVPFSTKLGETPRRVQIQR